MQTIRIITVFSCLTFLRGFEAQNCSQAPQSINVDDCCKLPEIFDENLVNQVQFAFADLQVFLSQCRVSEAIFEEMRLVKNEAIDKAAFLKFLDKRINDTDWKTKLKSSAEKCQLETVARKEALIKTLERAPYHVPHSECNVIPVSFSTCLRINSLVTCPSAAFNPSEECKSLKTWVTKCGGTLDALLKIMAKRS